MGIVGYFEFDQVIGKIEINSITLFVFSNTGFTNSPNETSSVDFNGDYLGIKWQCVEFVRRYIYLKHNENLSRYWSEGDAVDWFKNRDKMDMIQISGHNAAVGDICCFEGGLYGHIAIVRNILKHEDNTRFLEISSQNVFNNEKDLSYIVDLLNPIIDTGVFIYKLQGIIRYT